MPPKKFAVNLVDISFARAVPSAWYGANISSTCARSEWVARPRRISKGRSLYGRGRPQFPPMK